MLVAQLARTLHDEALAVALRADADLVEGERANIELDVVGALAIGGVHAVEVLVRRQGRTGVATGRGQRRRRRLVVGVVFGGAETVANLARARELLRRAHASRHD